VPAVALSASLVFLAGILLEGEGLVPLRTGLWLALHSHTEGFFRANVVLAATQSWPISVAAILALTAWSVGLFGRWAAQLVPEPWFRLGGVCLTGGFATLLQLVRTPYLHYALLGLPLLVAGSWVVATGLYRRLPALDRRALAGLLVLVLAAVPLTRTESRRRYVELWPLHSAPYPAYDRPWEDVPAVARDLEALRSQVRPGEDLLIFPPRRNVVHFRLGTRSLSFPQGYGWTREPRALDSLRSPTLAAVLVITGYLSAVDREVCAWHGCAEAVRELSPAGFVEVASLPTMTLWRREPAPPKAQITLPSGTTPSFGTTTIPSRTK
jgi:hypothetical protein